MNDRAITARHEAAHAVVSHVLGVTTERIFIDPQNDRCGGCVPQDVFRDACGENNLRHPVTNPQEHSWCVLVARRHAIGALAGIVMEELLTHDVRHVPPVAADSEQDLKAARQDVELATKYVKMIGQPYFSSPDIDVELAKLRGVARAILQWSGARNAVEQLASVLESENEIADAPHVRSIIDGAGARFGCGFSPLAANITFY